MCGGAKPPSLTFRLQVPVERAVLGEAAAAAAAAEQLLARVAANVRGGAGDVVAVRGDAWRCVVVRSRRRSRFAFRCRLSVPCSAKPRPQRQQRNSFSPVWLRMCVAVLAMWWRCVVMRGGAWWCGAAVAHVSPSGAG